MGDRANIAVIHENNDQVWLYGHWAGYDMPGRLQVGLDAAKGRWDDYSYANKIIFGHVVPKDNWQEETGYGISCSLQDNEYKILVVDLPKARVFLIEEKDLVKFKVPKGFEPLKSQCWTFAEYLALTKLPWGERHEEKTTA